MKKLLLSALLSIAISGCVSTSQVAQIDRDTYVVSSSSSSAFINNQNLLTASAEEARKFCADQNKVMEQETDRFIGSGHGFGRRQFMFHFRCVDE